MDGSDRIELVEDRGGRTGQIVNLLNLYIDRINDVVAENFKVLGIQKMKNVSLGAGEVVSVCQKTPLSELSCHDPPHFPRQLQPNFVQEDASDRSGWGDWWWTGPDLRDAAIGRRSRLLGSGFKG